MNLFRRSKVDPAIELRVAGLEAEVSKLASVVRQFEGELALQSDQVRKWMRRAVAAERNQERAEQGTPRAPLPPAEPTRRQLWGARSRRLARLLRDEQEPTAASAPLNGEDGSNGLHS